MDTIYFENGTYSALNVYILDPFGKPGRLPVPVPAGRRGVFRRLPQLDFALLAFSASDNSLQHASRVRPSLAVNVIRPNLDMDTRELTDEDKAQAEEFACDFGESKD